MTEPRFSKQKFPSEYKKDKIGAELARATEKKSQESLEKWQKAFAEARKKTAKNPNRVFEYSELFSTDTTASGFHSAFILKANHDQRYSNLYANSGILETHTFALLRGRYSFYPNSEISTRQAEAARDKAAAIKETKSNKKIELDVSLAKDLFSKLQIGGKVHWMQIRQLYNDKEINGSKIVMRELACKKFLLKLASEGYLEETRVEEEIWYKRIK